MVRVTSCTDSSYTDSRFLTAAGDTTSLELELLAAVCHPQMQKGAGRRYCDFTPDGRDHTGFLVCLQAAVVLAVE